MSKKLLFGLNLLVFSLNVHAADNFNILDTTSISGGSISGGTVTGSTITSSPISGSTGSFTSVTDTGLTASTLVSNNGSKLLTSYAGATCTNQFVRSLSAAGASTCNTVAATDLASSLALTTPNIGAATGTSLSVSGNLGTNVLDLTNGPGTYKIQLSAGTAIEYVVPTAKSHFFQVGAGYMAGITSNGVESYGTLYVETGGSNNKVVCWKTGGKYLGFCSSIVDVTGACTCN